MDYTLIPGKFADVSTASDSNVSSCIGLYIGGAGVVKVKGSDGATSTFNAMGGSYLTGRFASVLSTGSGTTATGIVALYP